MIPAVTQTPAPPRPAAPAGGAHRASEQSMTATVPTIPAAPPRPGQTRSRRALTYVELLLSLTIMGLIFGGIISAMLIASQALPDPTRDAPALIAAQRVLDELAADLADATDITEFGPNAITFVVPDRDGDDQPETIHYGFSGTSGDPLVRAINTAPSENLLDALNGFELRLETFTRQVVGSPSAVTSGETLLFSWESTSNIGEFSISSTQWPGQYFRPLLPPDAQSWAVTRVQFRAAQRGPANGITRVQLQIPDGSQLPSGTILEEHLLDEGSLDSSYNWEEIAFTTVSGLTPGTGLCLVLQWVSSKHSASIEYQTSGVGLDNARFVFTTDGGASWSGPSAAAMLIRVYGTITTPGPPTVTTRTYVRTIRIRLQPAVPGAPTLETRARLLNEPEITP